MTCDACVKLICMYVKRIPGVEEVLVSREEGMMHIKSAVPLTRDQVQASLKETAYQVTQY